MAATDSDPAEELRRTKERLAVAAIIPKPETVDELARTLDGLFNR